MDRRLNPILNHGNYHGCKAYYVPSYPDGLMGDILDGTITNYAIADFLQNNSDYITGLKFFPLDIELFMIGEATAYPIIGKNTITTYNNFKDWTDWDSYLKVAEFTVGRTFSNFLDFAPYTKIQLYFPFFELIELEPYLIYGYTIRCLLSLDIYVGVLSLQVERDDGLILYHGNVTVGIEIPIGKTNAEDIKRNNVLHSISLLGSALNIGVGAVTGNPISTSAGIGTATKGITGAMASNVNRLTSYKGANGCRNEIVCDKRIRIIKEIPTDISRPSVQLKGKPCFDNQNLTDVHGYTEIGEIHFNPDGNEIYDDEINEIVELLKSGVILP